MSIWEFVEVLILAKMAFMVSERVKLKWGKLKFFLMRISTPPPALFGTIFLDDVVRFKNKFEVWFSVGFA
jgi:hypothetical protein